MNDGLSSAQNHLHRAERARVADRPHTVTVFFTAALVLAFSGIASAQFKSEEPSKGAKLDQEVTQRYQLGVIIKAIGGPCSGIIATSPMPTDWPSFQETVPVSS